MIKALLASGLVLSTLPAFAANLTVEELRIEKATSAMPQVLSAFSADISQFEQQWQGAKSYAEAKDRVQAHASELWQSAKQRLTSSVSYDDRELYWARLHSSKVMRSVKPAFAMSAAEQATLLALLEHGSRGRDDLEYTKGTEKKILLTGFDPFLLDKNINQSNPSGAAALLLDGQVISFKGVQAEINTVMIPVRYEDFDQGLIEEILAPYYALNNVDMVSP